MKELVARIQSQIHSTGSIFYESPGGYLSKELERQHKPANGKEYINQEITMKIEGKKSFGTYQKKDSYLTSAKKPKGCSIKCKHCLDCTEENSCTYNKGIY